MARRALVFLAIALWLGAGAAFGLLGMRAIRLEGEKAVADARRAAESLVDATALYLPLDVRAGLDVQAGLGGSRYAVPASEGRPAADSLPALEAGIPPDDRLVLDQAAFVERTGNTAEAMTLLGRLVGRLPLDRAGAIATLRAGALARAIGDVDRGDALLRSVSEVPIAWSDFDGLPIAATAWRLLAGSEASRGVDTSTERLLALKEARLVFPTAGQVSVMDLLAAAFDDVVPHVDRLSPELANRLVVAWHHVWLLCRASDALGSKRAVSFARRPAPLVDPPLKTLNFIAVRSEDGDSVEIAAKAWVVRAIGRRAGRALALGANPPLDDAPWRRGPPPYESFVISDPGWRGTVERGFGTAPLIVGLVLYLVGGLLGILWIRRSAQAARMQADFVAAVSHEMKTPIAGIQAMAELLADGRVPEPERAHAYAERIRAEASRLGAGVRSVLDAARIERDPSSIVRPGPLEPSALVLDLASVLRPVIEGRGYVLRVAATPARREIPIDPDAFTSVLGNLLDNAAKFSTERREIDVVAAPADGGYRVTVSDRGPGVPDGERARIFERFRRGEHARRAAIPGVGLGLHVAKRFVEAHGGTIVVRAREGGGAEFTVLWPEGAT